MYVAAWPDVTAPQWSFHAPPRLRYCVSNALVSLAPKSQGHVTAIEVADVASTVGAAGPDRFSYQAILSSPNDAESTSASPSLSKSAACTNRALATSEEITRCAENEPPPRFSYQAIL